MLHHAICHAFLMFGSRQGSPHWGLLAVFMLIAGFVSLLRFRAKKTSHYLYGAIAAFGLAGVIFLCLWLDTPVVSVIFGVIFGIPAVVVMLFSGIGVRVDLLVLPKNPKQFRKTLVSLLSVAILFTVGTIVAGFFLNYPGPAVGFAVVAGVSWASLSLGLLAGKKRESPASDLQNDNGRAK